MKQKNASYAVAALAALIAVGGGGAVRAQSQQYPPPPGVPVPTEPANRIPQSGPDSLMRPGEANRAPRLPEAPTSDADFVRMLTASNTAELDQAKYMINHTTSPTVRAFAQRMIDDHSMAAVKLQAATRGLALGAPPPRLTTQADLQGMEMLAMLSGTQRDRAYMREQVRAHRRAIALLRWESDNGKVPSLKVLASDLLPTIQAHTRMALAYEATGGTSMAVDMVAPAGTSPNGTLPNNPATTSGGQTGGASNATGASRSTNTITNPNRPATLSQPTPGPNQPSSPIPAASPH